jgi:adenylyltransferase/sulfurtransferase
VDSRDKRYIRHLALPEIGEAGQRKLASGAVLIVGGGGLGGFHAELLTRAGVGRIRLADRDRVDWSNLPRQILYDEHDAETHAVKVERAAARLRAINSTVEVETHAVDVSPANIEALLDGVDLALDATDNFETRLLINDTCVKHGIPWIYGGIVGAGGMLMLVRPGEGPCLRCLLPEPPAPGSVPTPETAGVLSSAVAIVAAWQVTLALRVLVGAKPEEPKLISVDPWQGSFRALKVKRAERCPCCVERKFIFLQKS